jgi:hypothetical protein
LARRSPSTPNPLRMPSGHDCSPTVCLRRKSAHGADVC